MAYATGAYTAIDGGSTGALEKLIAFALANGWSQNGTTAVDGTGYRAHLQKTIGATTCYFNFRSGTAEGMTNWSWYPFTGIAVIGSTGYNAGSAWNAQPGYTPLAYNNATAGGACVHALKTTGGTYHFFASGATLSAVFETESPYADWRMLTIGTVGGWPFFAASGGNQRNTVSGTSYDARSAYLLSGYSAGTTAAASLFDGTYWYSYSMYDHNATYSFVPQVGAATLRGSVAAPIVYYSPDSFRGNVQLAPSHIAVEKDIDNELWPVGEIEGVKFVNMTNHNNGEQVTYDGDDYRLFRIFNPKAYGVAFLE